MFSTLPKDPIEFMGWSWTQIEPYVRDLTSREINAQNVDQWLSDWTQLRELISETYARLTVAVTTDTTDAAVEQRYNDFLDNIYSPTQAADQKLKEKLLASGIEPRGFVVPLRRMRTEAAIFRTENLPLLAEERKLASRFNKIIGAQTVPWDGDELTLMQLRRVKQTPERSTREHAWRLASERQLVDRDEINAVWMDFMRLRKQLAKNAGLLDYRAYRWNQMLRLDYTPEDSLQFQQAIEQVAVPAATRLYEKYRQGLGVETLRPWDLDQDLYTLQQPPLPSYGDVAALQSKAEVIFRKLDPQLGEYFHIMRTGGYLDLENRKGKAPGGYCTSYPVTRRPFIFMNAVGLAGDVRTILHEAGHAFHNFERFHQPYAQQRIPGLEFAEVASMAMELFTHPYIAEDSGGFYSADDARRYRIGHMEHILFFWPFMAVVDAFQHWVYTNHDRGVNPNHCDAKWLELWERFFPGVDWDGLESEAETGWHRKQHIHRYPFYYIEYGLAQMGALQVWQNALRDPEDALARYRGALRLGGTVPLPDLYKQAGAKFAFDVDTLGEVVELVESMIVQLEAEQGG